MTSMIRVALPRTRVWPTIVMTLASLSATASEPQPPDNAMSLPKYHFRITHGGLNWDLSSRTGQVLSYRQSLHGGVRRVGCYRMANDN